MKRLALLFALCLCLCGFVGASEEAPEDDDLILPSLADIGFPNAPDADKPRIIKAEEFESADSGVLVTNETPVAINPQDVARETEQAAQALYELGLFRGTSTAPDGTPVFDLDSVPTRNQAVIMLIRLLGKEEEALSGKWKIPFKDVKANSTTAPYISYAYANGLTKGTSETTYSGTNPVTRNQYLLFLMRAMGYANHTLYSGGMSTEDAAQVAEKLGLLDGTDAGRFTRGDVALISNRALDAYMCFNKPDLQTLREALNLGASPKLPDQYKTFSVDASYRQYADMAEIKKEYSGTYTVKEEISVPGGKIIHFVLGGGPHGTIQKLIHACDDGKVYDLPLPTLNSWGLCPEPKNFAYDAETGKLTYETEIPQDLEWRYFVTLRLAGTYRYTYRPAERAGSVALVSLSGTYENPQRSSADTEVTETVSVNPKDYGITDAMLHGEESANISQLSLEALGAYHLHTDGAMSESSAEELYQRFMRDPDTVLAYLAKLGDQMSRRNDTAATELCRAIASADVFGYDATPEFSAVLQECRKRYPFGQISALLNALQSAYDEAVENAKRIANSPTAEANAETR